SDVVASLAPVAVELGSLPERDRAARIAAVQLYTETEMLAVADRCKLAELAARRQQRHFGIGQAERRQRAQLFAELERELRPARKNCVDDGRPDEILRAQQAVRLSRERLGERLDPVRHDRQARRCAMTPEPFEECRGSAKRSGGIEGRDRASG